MGKNETIASLENQLKGLAKENDGQRERYHRLLDEKNEFEKAAQLEFQKHNEMHSGIVKQLQAQIKELQEHKSLMIVNVHIIGGQDIDKALDSSVKILEKRLESLGLKDDYDILAIPHTLALSILR